jgi:hypothetical protein
MDNNIILSDQINANIEQNVIDSLKLSKETNKWLRDEQNYCWTNFQDARRDEIFQNLYILKLITKSNLQELFDFIHLFLDIYNEEHKCLINNLHNVLLLENITNQETILLLNQIFIKSRDYVRNGNLKKKKVIPVIPEVGMNFKEHGRPYLKRQTR